MTDTTTAALADDAGEWLPRPQERPWPAVSVVMTVLNEAPYLADTVERILAQEYRGEVELVIALGPSRDGTDRIARKLAFSDSRIKLVTNPSGRTPAGLNAAVLAASHGIIARVDGHGGLTPGYMEKAVELLERTGAANVGGLMLALGETGFEQAVARAYCSKAGLGGGSFHVGGVEGPAESVYLGVFRREVLERLGGFNDHYHRAQDWELNFRIRQAGELVWFSPDLAATYRPRSSWVELVRQFFHTGRWRREVIRQYPDTVSARYLASPVVTGSILVGTLAGVFGAVAAVSLLHTGWLAPLAYLIGVLAAALWESRGLSLRARVWMPAVLATMHLSWGAGFLFGRRPGAPRCQRST
jgi:succinoglycan biosynthesis protein ExoA